MSGAALIAGCARDRLPELSMWGLGEQGEATPVLLSRFRRNTGIDVTFQTLPVTESHEKVLTAFAGGVLPDVLMVGIDWLPELAAIRAIQPLPGAAAMLAGQMPAASRSVTVADTAWALPSTIATQAQFYRTDLVAAVGYREPPPRRAEWTAMLRAIKRRSPDNYALLMLLDWPEHLMTFAGQEQAEPLRDRDSRGNFSSPEFRSALGYYKSLFDEGLAPRVTLADIGDTITAFARGLFAIMPSAGFTIGDLAKRTGDIPRPLWDVVPMAGPDGMAAAPIGGTSLTVTAHARDPARAWALVRYLGGTAAQVELCGLTGVLPTRAAAWEAPTLRRDPALTAFSRQLVYPAFAPAVLEWTRIQTEMQLVAERVGRGELGIAEAVREMDRRADALLAKRRWLLDRGLIA